MALDLFSIVFFLGAIQGLILALYLFFSRSDKRQAKYFLGVLILVLSYDMFETALFAQRIRLFTTDLFAFSLLFTLGPSLAAQTVPQRLDSFFQTSPLLLTVTFLLLKTAASFMKNHSATRTWRTKLQIRTTLLFKPLRLQKFSHQPPFCSFVKRGN